MVSDASSIKGRLYKGKTKIGRNEDEINKMAGEWQ